MKFEPVFGKYLIKPLRAIKVTRRVPVPDEEANKDKKPGEVRDVKKVSMRLLANFQLAELVAVPAEGSKFNVGDTVVYRPNPAAYIEFDLIKGLFLIDAYLVVGKWEEDTNES